MADRHPLLAGALLALSGCTTVLPSVGVAPDECFRPGTALSFAGRSTTAALGVQEVVGDPMSDDLADIYITRDELDIDGVRGRRVCAVFVDTPGFVEITVHPEDGGRVSVPEATPEPPRPPNGISEDEAVAIARDFIPESASWKLANVHPGPLGQFPAPTEMDVGADVWVWRVTFTHDSAYEGTDVLIDYVDGTVLGRFDWIS